MNKLLALAFLLFATSAYAQNAPGGLPYFTGTTPSVSNLNSVVAYINNALGYTGSAAIVNGQAINIATGAVTTSSPVINLSQTWNNASTVFTGIVSNITNTASSSSSKLLDLQVGGVSQFSVTQAGGIAIAGITGSSACTSAVICNNAGALALPNSLVLGGTNVGADNPAGSSMLKLTGGSSTVYFGALNQTGYTGILSLGDGNSTAPTAQGIAGQNAVVTSNAAGGNLLLLGGESTGTGAGGSIIFQTSPASGTSGAGQNATVTNMSLNSVGSLFLTNASSHSGQATCWTTSGQIGYCTTVVSASGACTCTGL